MNLVAPNPTTSYIKKLSLSSPLSSIFSLLSLEDQYQEEEVKPRIQKKKRVKDTSLNQKHP
jgi:hypothetical protein